MGASCNKSNEVKKFSYSEVLHEKPKDLAPITTGLWGWLGDDGQYHAYDPAIRDKIEHSTTATCLLDESVLFLNERIEINLNTGTIRTILMNALGGRESLLLMKEYKIFSHFTDSDYEEIDHDALDFATSQPEGCLNLDEIYSIAVYTHNHGKPFYEHFNNALRTLDTCTNPRAKECIDGFSWAMQRALGKLDVVKGQTVYRGIRNRSQCGEYVTGATIHWRAFTSTSQDERVARASFAVGGGVLFEIDITDGRDIKPYSLFSIEKEILLLPNSEFMVTERDDTGDILRIKMTQSAKGVVVY
eukprot:PhF_6_TR5616/c0_g1_i4/m.8135